jgi:soluble lytic murein transglycosylase-like protein
MRILVLAIAIAFGVWLWKRNQTPGAAPVASPEPAPRSGGGIRSWINQYADYYGVPRSIAQSTAYVESRYNPAAKSSVGALGIFQLMPGTADDLGVDASDPEQNIAGGMSYLRSMYDRFGSWDLALAGYNAGPGAVRKYGGIPPYAETQNYVNQVLARADAGYDDYEEGV